MNEEEHVEIHGGLKAAIGMIRYLHGPMDYANTLKLRVRVRGRDLPERRIWYTSSRAEEKEGAETCSCGKADEGGAHILGKCELYKEEGNVLRET